MELSRDVVRCRGHECDQRQNCARYRCWPLDSPYTTNKDRLCEPHTTAEMFILYRKDLKEQT